MADDASQIATVMSNKIQTNLLAFPFHSSIRCRGGNKHTPDHIQHLHSYLHFDIGRIHTLSGELKLIMNNCRDTDYN